jgi:hypothetical protein
VIWPGLSRSLLSGEARPGPDQSTGPGGLLAPWQPPRPRLTGGLAAPDALSADTPLMPLGRRVFVAEAEMDHTRSAEK